MRLFVQPGRKGVEPSYHASKAAGLPLADTRVSFVKRVPCRSRTDLTGLEVQDLCRSANGTLKKAPALGFEPTLISLTGGTLPSWLHRNIQSGWSDLNRRSRAPEARGVPSFPTP